MVARASSRVCAPSCGRAWAAELREAVPGRPWLTWPPEKPWGTADRWAREVVGLGWAKLMAIVRELDEQAAHELEVITAPEFFLLDANFDHAEIIQPFEAEERLRALRESEHPPVRELIAKAEAAAGGDILTWVKQAMVLERSEELTKMRRAARHDQAKAQVNNARHTIVRNVLGLRSGGRKTVDSSQYGPIYNALDGEYIRLTGLPQKKMTVTDLQAKYAWLEAINDQVRAKNVPDFLDL